MQTILTLAITTYNREKALREQLQSIFRQPEYLATEIVLLDNCSSYDLPRMLEENFSEKERSVIRLIRHTYNTEACYNIASAFLTARTKWLWLLSDDDVTEAHSLACVQTYLAADPDCACFKFTDIGDTAGSRHPEEEIASMADLLHCVDKRDINLGNFIFMSNNVYNLDKLAPYLPSAFKYSYTFFPHVIPLITGLADRNIRLRLINERIVTYRFPDAPPGPDRMSTIYLSTFTFSDIPLDISPKERKALMKFFRMNTLYNTLYFGLQSQRRFKSDYYRKAYLAHRAGGWNMRDYATYLFFLFLEKTGLNLLSVLKNIYAKIHK